MGSHILLVNSDHRGHVLPSLSIVAELVRRGHRVTYLTVDSCAALVEAAGARVLRYEAEYAPTDLGASSDRINRGFERFVLKSREIVRVALAGLAADPPDLVLYDDFLPYAGMQLAEAFNRSAARLCPAFASNEHFSLRQQMWQGGADPAIAEAMLAQMADTLQLLGLDVSFDEFMAGCEEGLNVVYLPKSFQIDADTFGPRFAFVGPCLDRSAVTWQPPASGLPVVLVSLGTSFNDHPEFFRMCVEAFTGEPWHVVITTGGGADLGQLPSNIEVHEWVDQLAVLEHTAVFVTRGGTGSLMESFHANTPVVVVPQTPDVVLNANQVVELGLGRTVPFKAITAAALLDNVREVAGDPAIARNVAAIRAEIQAAGGAGRAVDEIVAYVKQSVIGAR